MPTAKRQHLLAAVDLGSNSFRLEIGAVDGGQILRRLYLKETVRLGAGVDARGRLTAAAIERSAECLARFRGALAGVPPGNIRAVATNAVRVATNPEEFLKRAVEALGHPIEVISGREEARLIYQGVSHLLPHSEQTRLVVDIGGGSTELIVGRGFTPLAAESFKLGSVSESLRFFGGKRIGEADVRSAEVAVAADLEEAAMEFAKPRWQVAYGSSGTAGAIADIGRAAGLTDGRITPRVLQFIRRALVNCKSLDKLDLPGLKADRRAVLGGGYAVLAGVFETLHVDEMIPAKGALRHGVLYDLLGRHEHVDARDATVAVLQRRFNVDATHATAVAMIARALLRQLNSRPEPHAEHALERAAQLHEVGQFISHGDFHKHGAYILENGDLAGFSRDDQRLLAGLVLAQRGNLGKVARLLQSPADRELVVALRLAILVCHTRQATGRCPLRVAWRANMLRIATPRGWLERHPHAAFLLDREAAYWQAVDIKVRLSASD